jgi:hypothetical protein
LLSVSTNASAAETGFTFGVEKFVWKEFDEGSKLLEENGERYVFGFEWEGRTSANPNMVLGLQGTAYVGSPAYDGQACTTTFPQTCMPFETDTKYRGVSAEMTVAHRAPTASGTEFFGGLGVDGWRRQIQGTSEVSGAVEKWTTAYALLGAGGFWSAGGSSTLARVGAKYPFYTRNAASDVTLEPKGRLSWFARIAADFLNAGRPVWGLGLRYDSYRFDESDAERVGAAVVWQPESSQDTLTAYLKYYLR